MNPSKEQILEKLKTVQDPEMKRDIVSLGKVSIERDGKDSLVHFDTGQGLACCL